MTIDDVLKVVEDVACMICLDADDNHCDQGCDKCNGWVHKHCVIPTDRKYRRNSYNWNKFVCSNCA